MEVACFTFRWSILTRQLYGLAVALVCLAANSRLPCRVGVSMIDIICSYLTFIESETQIIYLFIYLLVVVVHS